jgi:hypothetical protein
MTKRSSLSSVPEITHQDLPEALDSAAGGSYPNWDEIARASQMMHVASLRRVTQMRRVFKDEAARYRFLERLRWPGGFACSRCGAAAPPARPQPGLLSCDHCGALTSVTAGTLLRRPQTLAKDWFELLWGIAADDLCIDVATVMEVAKLPTEHMAQRGVEELYDVVAGCGRQQLAGVVEVDSRVLDLGGVRVIVLVGIQREAGKSVRSRMRHVPNVGRDAIRRFVNDVIEPGSTVRTDCWTGYAEIASSRYRHQIDIMHPTGPRLGLPGVNRAMSLLRRWLRTRPAVSPAHLAGLLDEFCFRLDHAGRSTVGAMFCKLLEKVMQTTWSGRGLRCLKSGVRTIDSRALPEDLDESGQQRTA